jgi:sucrose-phosphate synthase
VVELAKALSRHPAVHRVDLLTRLVRDPKVDASYGVLEEPLTEPEGQMGGAYIARIPCGPVNTYLRCVACLFDSACCCGVVRGGHACDGLG